VGEELDVSRVYQALQRSEGTSLASAGEAAGYRRGTGEGARFLPDEDRLDARRLLWVLYHKRWQVLLVATLVVGPTAVVTQLQERLYRSSTLIEVNPQPLQVLPYPDIASPNTTPNYVLSMRTYEEALKGSNVVSRVSERLRREPDADQVAAEIPRLHRRVSIQQVPVSQMFQISYVAPSPDLAARVANIWAEEFIKANFASRQATREQARELLSRELATLEQKVQASESELVKYAQTHGMQRDDAARTDLAQVRLSTLASEVTAADSELLVAQSRLKALSSASVRDFPERLVTQVIASRQAALLQLEHELTALRTSFGEKWPAVVQKRNEISVVQEQLDREKAVALAQAREQALLEYRAALNKRRMLGASLEEQKQLVAQLQNASVKYNIIKREVETNQKLYEGLLERLKQTGVSPGMEFENIRVVEPAVPATTVASPRVWWNLFLASVLGLALGVSFVLARDFWDNSVSGVEDIEQLTVTPVLGSVPLVKLPNSRPSLLGRSTVRSRSGSDRSLSMLGEFLSEPRPAAALTATFVSEPAAAEAIRSICASILLSRSERPPQVLMVTSALPGEGKTTVVGQLGLAFAESGARTLLVECDLRRPTYASFFGLDADRGLSAFLAGHVAAPTLHRILEDRLYAVSAGPVAPNPAALLHSEKMKAFLTEACRSFRFVIIDAPPVLPVADARLLGAMVEGVVLVVRAGVTSKRLLQRVCALLEHAGSNIIGTVLNGAAWEESSSLYYRYYRQARD